MEQKIDDFVSMLRTSKQYKRVIQILILDDFYLKPVVPLLVIYQIYVVEIDISLLIRNSEMFVIALPQFDFVHDKPIIFANVYRGILQ